MQQIYPTGYKFDTERQGCPDCRFRLAHVSWWCHHEEAVKRRGTKMPGVKGCQFWKPARTMKDLTCWERWFGFDIAVRKFISMP